MSISTATRFVCLIGHPVEHSLSPRMQNAAFAELGLDWAYLALDVPPEDLADAVRGLAALGFAGANVTAPHKLAVARLMGSDLPSVNTLAGGKAYSTDTAILDGLAFDRAAILGDGGAAAAFKHALPQARVFSRRGDWPPQVADADLVDQRDTRARRGARRAARRARRSSTSRIRARPRRSRRRRRARACSTASRCSSRRAQRRSSCGPASPAPVAVMRTALGLP